MDKIGIYLPAYNAEKTLARMIESILAQTYKNFDLYLGDNASTDKTFEIIKLYCDRFDFILCYRRKVNFTGSFLAPLYGLADGADYDVSFAYKCDRDGKLIPVLRERPDWMCFIDSDDTLEPTYLEDMLRFAKENDLDMVLSGWDFVRPNRIDHRVPEKNEIICRSEFSSRLSYYDKFMGPMWNKLFRYKSMAKNISYYENKFSRLFRDGVYFYGADTAYIYLYLGNDLDRFGILAKSLYKYYVSDDSVSRKHFHPMRIVADRRMAEVRFDFLQSIGAEITEENKDFIMNIYFKSIKSTMDLLLHDDRYDLKQQMKYLNEMFNYKLLDEIFPQREERYL